MRACVAEVEVLVAERKDHRVDLDTGDVDRVSVRKPVLARGRAACESQDGDRPRVDLGQLRPPEGVRNQQVVPVAVCEVVGRVVDGVDRLALVEDELGHGAGLHDLDVVVGGFALCDQRAHLGRLDARGENDPGEDHRDGKPRVQPLARPHRCDREQDEHQPEAFERRPRAEARDEPEDGQERAEDAAGS